MVDKFTIGRRIKAQRKYLGLTQVELGKILGVEDSTISMYETGKNEIKASELPNFAAALSVPVTYFYDESEVDAPSISAYYDGLPPLEREMVDEVIYALYLKHQRDETTHGKKAE